MSSGWALLVIEMMGVVESNCRIMAVAETPDRFGMTTIRLSVSVNPSEGA